MNDEARFGNPPNSAGGSYSDRAYPPAVSDVEVTFTDGVVQTYRITASHKIGEYMAKRAGETGVLTLFNDEESIGIPMQMIREYAIRTVKQEPGS